MDMSSYFGLYEKTFCPEQNTDLIHAVFYMAMSAEDVADFINDIYEDPENSNYTLPGWVFTCGLGSTIICSDKIIILAPNPAITCNKTWYVFPGEE